MTQVITLPGDAHGPAPEPTSAEDTAAAVQRRLRRERTKAYLGSIGWSLANFAITMTILIVAWQVVILGVSAFVGKGPLDTFFFLFLHEKAAEHWAELGPLVGQTLLDAAFGFAVGMVVAVALAMTFTLSKTIEAGVMPLALLLRSVPLVAIAPVILLITGIGTPASVAVIVSIVVLFPALASVMFGLGRASKESLDLIRVYGGSSFTALLKARIPGALPSLFAAARVSVPGAMTGALLAEWLSTGAGIGGTLQRFSAGARFNELWASVAIITVITLVLYNLVQLLENTVLARVGMAAKLS